MLFFFKQKTAYEMHNGDWSSDVCSSDLRWTGEYQYTLDLVLADMISRCRELNLHVAGSERRLKTDLCILLTVQTMNYLHTGRHRMAM